MKSKSFPRGWLGALALTASACLSIADLPRVPEDAGEEPIEEDAPFDAGADEPDAEDGDADGGWPEASPADAATMYEDAPTQSVMEGGANIELPILDASALPRCDSSTDCAADQACSGGQCISRCTSYGACVVHQAARGVVLMTDIDAVYWRVMPSVDALGNSRKDGELWRMVHGSAPIRVLKNLGENVQLVVRGGYVYFHQGQRLYRSLVQADAPVEPLYQGVDPSTWLVGDSSVAFVTTRGIEVGSLDGSAPLRTIAFDMDPKYSLVALAADRIYFQRSDAPGATVWSVRVVEPFTLEKTSARFFHGSNAFVRGSTLYHECDQGLCAEDLDDGTLLFLTRLPDLGGGGTTSGDWTYWGNPTSPIERFSLVDVGTSQTVVPRGAGLGSFAVVRDRFYFSPALEVYPGYSTLIYEMPLPPEPCSATLPCPNGKSCASDSLCR